MDSFSGFEPAKLVLRHSHQQHKHGDRVYKSEAQASLLGET
jgi:hypothetical protein